jgi:SAM-dependent methyltransferase
VAETYDPAISEGHIDELYRLALRREPDPEARAEAAARLAEGALSRAGLLAELVASAEFARLRALDDGIALARRARAAGERPHELVGPPGTDERVIEVPWVLARYRGEPRVLDLGSANADRAYLDALIEAVPGEPIGADLAVAEIPGMRTLVADARRLPLDDGSIDALLCVSTLEHIGSSQEVYGVDAERDHRGIAAALAAALGEMRRVLASRGYALVTVPCGREEDHGWFVQHDRETWNRLFAEADLFVSDQEVYALGPEGWRAGGDDRAGYGERGPAASAVLCSELHPGRLRHTAAERAHRLLRRG